MNHNVIICVFQWVLLTFGPHRGHDPHFENRCLRIIAETMSTFLGRTLLHIKLECSITSFFGFKKNYLFFVVLILCVYMYEQWCMHVLIGLHVCVFYVLHMCVSGAYGY